MAKAEAEGRGEQRRVLLQVALGAALGFAVLLLLIMAPADDTENDAKRRKPLTAASRAAALALGLGLGALGGYAASLLQVHARRGAVLPPLESNEAFAAKQMRGDSGGAGELRERKAAQPSVSRPGVPGGAEPTEAAGGAEAAGVRSRRPNAKAGRAAALKAMGKAR